MCQINIYTPFYINIISSSKCRVSGRIIDYYYIIKICQFFYKNRFKNHCRTIVIIEKLVGSIENLITKIT